ncbi:hypothetical protein [Novosphingobium lentum]|uniref:hypothetical protein n=1 Tax=Novosphingobium lentum TaxID=145287 RepID=UPI0012ED2F50|nr:hypothetical protein [Novosphingobium lentum]
MAQAVRNASEVECLVIEDFGTKGLTGETDRPGGGFYAFWRQYGKSNKQGDTGGRHGEGKSTLAGASIARMFFGLTIREDGRALLMGQTILGPHDLNGRKYEAYGEFSPTEGDHFPEPFENRPEIEKFFDDFKLSRSTECGLSLVVPFARPEILDDDLAAVKCALVANCFPQVASGLLSFDVEGDTLDASTVMEWADRWPSLNLRGAIAVATEAIQQTRFWDATERAELSADSFSSEDVAQMRKAFTDGELVSVRLPVTVKPIGGGELHGAALLHMRKTGVGENYSEHYARSRLTVPKQRRVLAGGDVIGLLMAADGPLSDFLGDAEPPSHARWTNQNLRDVGKYRNTQATLAKVANALRQLERVLRDEDAESVNREAFKSLFSRPKPKPRIQIEPTPTPTPPIDLPPARPFWAVQSRPGGFAVRRPSDVEVSDVVVEVAYAQRRGPPNWNETDFSFGQDIEVAQVGDANVEASGNVIRVTGALAALTIEANGFDANRDLVVTVRAMGDDDVEA